MSGIEVADPKAIEPVELVPGAIVRSPFAIGAARLEFLQVDDETAWYARDGPTYGWVRTGRGRIESGEPVAERTLPTGSFFRIPAHGIHRFVSSGDGLALIACVGGGPDAERFDAPGPQADNRIPVVVAPDALTPTVESANLVRETPFPDEPVLLMRVRAPGGAAAGWHHHGRNIYFGYAVDGPSETQYADETAWVDRGECFHVPPGLVHRDTNPTAVAHTGIIWLYGGAPWVVNVDPPT